jgi:hypothetical protein
MKKFVKPSKLKALCRTELEQVNGGAFEFYLKQRPEVMLLYGVLYPVSKIKPQPLYGVEIPVKF